MRRPRGQAESEAPGHWRNRTAFDPPPSVQSPLPRGQNARVLRARTHGGGALRPLVPRSGRLQSPSMIGFGHSVFGEPGPAKSRRVPEQPGCGKATPSPRFGGDSSASSTESIDPYRPHNLTHRPLEKIQRLTITQGDNEGKGRACHRLVYFEPTSGWESVEQSHRRADKANVPRQVPGQRIASLLGTSCQRRCKKAALGAWKAVERGLIVDSTYPLAQS